MYETGEQDAELGTLIAWHDTLDSKSKAEYEEGYAHKAWEMGASDRESGRPMIERTHFKLDSAWSRYVEGFEGTN